MSKMDIQIIGGAYEHPSRPANFQRCVNWFPTTSGASTTLEQNNALDKGRNTAVLLRRMGCASLGSIDPGGVDPRCRGLYQLQISIGVYLTVVVMGAKVYNLNFDYTTKTINPTLLGTLQTVDGIVQISSNATQIMFICYDQYNNQKKGSIYNYSTNTFTNITDGDFLGGSHVAMIDGYFIYNEVGSANFLFSDINNGLSYDALKIARAESSPDKIIGLGQSKGELWVFGTNSVEIWYDAANSPGSPFSKRVGSDIDVGCSAPYSICSANGSLLWLDSRRYIVMSDYSQFFRNQSSGYNVTKLSTEAIDAEIASYPIVSDCLSSVYNDNGHIMVEFTFPSVSKTWVRDTTMDMWHEKTYHDSSNNNTYQSLTNFYVQNEKYILATSLSNNNIYIVGREYLDDAGEKIHRIRTTQHVNSQFNQIEISSLEVKCNTGLQNNINQYDHILSSTINSFTTQPAEATIINMVSDYDFLFSPINSISFDGTHNIITTLNPFASFVTAGDLVVLFYPDSSITTGKIISKVGTTLTVDTNLYYSTDSTNAAYIGVGSSMQIGLNAFSADAHLLGTPNATVSDDLFKVGDTIRVTLNDGTTADIDVENILDTNRIVPPSNPTPTKTPWNIGNTILNLDDTAVDTINITIGSADVRVDDLVNISFNDGSIFQTTITEINGNDITMSDGILTSRISNGNAIEISRASTEHQQSHIGLRYSNDSGYTWSNSMDRELGKLGNYGKRITWGPLGSAHEWLFEFKMTDPIDTSIVDASVEGFVGDI